MRTDCAKRALLSTFSLCSYSNLNSLIYLIQPFELPGRWGTERVGELDSVKSPSRGPIPCAVDAAEVSSHYVCAV